MTTYYKAVRPDGADFHSGMETITDPALIRATDDPDERGDFPCCADRAHKESLGGDSESGTYNRSNRPPAGPCTDADNPWALLPDDHPQRPKQCGGCGTKWVDAETARACERRHGDDITIPAPVGAAVALDLEPEREAGELDAGGLRHLLGLRSEALARVAARAEAAEAEVVTLRARLAEAEALHWKVGGACSHCSQRSDYAVAWPCETAVALAGTTGEGE